ncbi:hypothetical protein VTK73DRAFT_1597 [Phialemonium thermophilum]|uniref:Uncharacterized protein n=1 Tax=Phialemonium thermophilum TaxID=223376 RepID=A0ABR3Y323_9PEZI
MPPKLPSDSASNPPAEASTSQEPLTTDDGTPSTPAKRKSSSANHGGATPKSAPAAAAGGNTGSHRRKKPEPTLLSDFLLGRPSPARIAAQRAAAAQAQNKRRKSMAADAAHVREELRQEMRAAAVRKLQQPGGVQARVKAWQKANAAAAKADATVARVAVDDAASEPTEILVQVDQESVTEEDRVRIKMRQKPKRRKPSKTMAKRESSGEAGHGLDRRETVDSAAAREDSQQQEQEAPAATGTRSRAAPKKRIVSDDHWMEKKKGKTPPRVASGKAKPTGKPSPIPKDFLLRTAQNPSIQNKIRDWATRVEPTEPSHLKKRRTESDGGGTRDSNSVATSDGATPSQSKSTDVGIRVTPVKPQKPWSGTDGSIRVKPVRKKGFQDGEIDFQSSEQSNSNADAGRHPARSLSPTSSSTHRSSSRRASSVRSTGEPSRKAPPRTDEAVSSGIKSHAALSAGEETETPTKRMSSSTRKQRRTASPATATRLEGTMDFRPDWDIEGAAAFRNAESESESERPSTVLDMKSLADIPFGYSAFSELDLPLGADARNSTRPQKGQRNPSFKGVPNVFKKVVNEGKKIIHDKVDPPKPVANQPPSIESWLSKTVDPFVDSAKPKSTIPEKDNAKECSRQTSHESNAQRTHVPNQDIGDSKIDEEETLKKQTAETPTKPGLKRSRATRHTSSPIKSVPKKPLREQLKEAFRGESAGYRLPCQTVGDPLDDAHDDEETPQSESRRKSSSSRRRSPSPEPSSVVESSVDSCSSATPLPKRRPPTHGTHELSTILSETSGGSRPCDSMSTLSETTVTQATALTESSGVSRERSQRGGLKRRLTKHSDMVSMLSLPENGQPVSLPRTRSLRTRHSVREKSGQLGYRSQIDDLLQDFEDDEYYYQKELKTLVDGVIPVLLTQVVRGDNKSATDLFGSPGTQPEAADALSKAVVNMGVALEKLKAAHKKAPVSNIQQILGWLGEVHALYDHYLDVWRLGFEDLIVNLAPALDRLDDGDSLVNAMPLNEEGDVLDHDGEPVNVAHLLKRPLIRVKWIVRFLRDAGQVLADQDVGTLLATYERLHEKARLRHSQERARKVDEDANRTDTTRTRDLRTLTAIKTVWIDQSRQVNAKDTFSLELVHSTGLRIRCNVELIYRDNIRDPGDKGDVIVRETDLSGRSWLLFPPIPKPQISARPGISARKLTVMVRGTHNGQEWYELLRLSADDQEQVADWLDILGSNPMPPDYPTSSYTLDSPSGVTDGHLVGSGQDQGQRIRQQSPPLTPRAKTASSEDVSAQREPSTPRGEIAVSPLGYGQSPSPDRTPTQEAFNKSPRPHSLPPRPSGDDDAIRNLEPNKSTRMRPNSAPYREDGAPPPPIHRTLGSSSPPSLSPGEPGLPSRIKRRTSSPLKHEYHPSDISSDSSAMSDDSDSSTLSDSYGDETDTSEDLDDTSEIDDRKETERLAALSTIEEGGRAPLETVPSECSLTPSNSASQAGLAGSGGSTPGYLVKFIASVSYWSARLNSWKDVSADLCSIAVKPGLMEAFYLNAAHRSRRPGSSDAAEGDPEARDRSDRPLIALDLTPLVKVRKSTAIDLEVRSPVLPCSLRNKIKSSVFRFRCTSKDECHALMIAVRHSREDNAKFKALQEEARINSFGQMQRQQPGEGSIDTESSSRRRSWFGRKNSYRASTRAPSQSQGSSSGMSANSFLKRLTSSGNLAFDLVRSTVDKQSRPGSVAGPSASLYTSSADSSSGGRSGFTFPRLPSVSLGDAGGWRNQPLGTSNLKIRLHLAIGHNKWEDYGNCLLDVGRPGPDMLPAPQLRPYLGKGKRITVRSLPRKKDQEPLTLIDIEVGSGCFGVIGNTGVVMHIWEELVDAEGKPGVIPARGGINGGTKRWLFQCPSVAQCLWIMSLVSQD